MIMKLWEIEPRHPSLQEESVLLELFNQPYDWEWMNSSSPTAVFKNEEDRFLVYFFNRNQRGRTKTIVVFASDEHLEDISGAGDQFKIFATVYDIIKDYISSNRVEWLSFSAKEPSRVRLYKKFAEGLSKKFDMRLKIEHDFDGSTEFNLIGDLVESSLSSEGSQNINEDGLIIPNVNTTVDVQPGETHRQAAKFGNHLDAKGRPPLLRGSYSRKEGESVTSSMNQGDPKYGPNGTRLRHERHPR